MCQTPQSHDDLMQQLGSGHRQHFREMYLLPALKSGLLERTIPDKPQSSKQRYQAVSVDGKGARMGTARRRRLDAGGWLPRVKGAARHLFTVYVAGWKSCPRSPLFREFSVRTKPKSSPKVVQNCHNRDDIRIMGGQRSFLITS
jgi:hypothetical protein